MTSALRDHLLAMTADQRSRMASDSRRELRRAWPHRETLRGRTVVSANVAMLRNLRSL